MPRIHLSCYIRPSSLIVFGCEGELPAILLTRGQKHWFGCSSCLPHVSHLQRCILSKRSEKSSWREEECSSVNANGLTALLEPPASSRTFSHILHLKRNPSLWKYLPMAVYHLCWWCPPCCHLDLQSWHHSWLLFLTPSPSPTHCMPRPPWWSYS